MGLTCCACGAPWRLDKPLLYHHDKLHCDSRACSRECDECKDWERAVEEGAAGPEGRLSEKAGERREVGNLADKDAAPVPSEGYAAMMKRLKGGAG